MTSVAFIVIFAIFVIMKNFENHYSPYNGSIKHNRKKMLKNLSKQSDYIKYQLLNGKVIQKTLTSHKFFNKFIF